MIKYSTETGYEIDRYRKFYLKEYNNDYKRLEALDRQFDECNEDIAYYNEFLIEEDAYKNKKTEFKSLSITNGVIAGIGLAILGGVCLIAPEFKLFGAMIAGACVTPTALIELYEIITYGMKKMDHNINLEIYDEEDAIAAENAKNTIVTLREAAKKIIDRMNSYEERLNYLEEYNKIYNRMVGNSVHTTGMRREEPTPEKRGLSIPSFVLKSDPFEIMPVSIIKEKQKELALVNSLND